MPGVSFFNKYSLDPDAKVFILAASITNVVQISAIDYLVKSLKNNGLWTRFNFLYPFVGGNDTAHKFNLKNPLNTDAAFRLTFAGTITHDANGATFSITDGWANTHLTTSLVGTLNNQHLSFYSRTSAAAASGGVDLGAAVSVTQRDELVIRSNIDLVGASINSTTAGQGNASAANTDGSGFYIASRTTSTLLTIYKNNASAATSTGLNNGTRSNIKMYLGCRNVTNVAQGFTGRNCALASYGGSLNSTQAATFYTIVQQYQTILGRQV